MSSLHCRSLSIVFSDHFIVSDLGAWHGYSLPDATAIGAFPGPWLWTHQHWLSSDFTQFKLISPTRTSLHARKPTLSATVHPGILRQSFEVENGLKVTMELIFVSSRDTGIRISVFNPTPRAKSFRPVISGTAQHLGCTLVAANKGVHASIPYALAEAGTAKLELRVDPHLRTDDVFITPSKKTYTIAGKVVAVRPGDTFVTSMTQSLYFTEAEAEAGQAVALGFLADHGQQALMDNRARWDRYLQPVLERVSTEQQRWLAAKAVVTLVNNWRSPHAAFKHSTIYEAPSMLTWSWSGNVWKNAV